MGVSLDDVGHFSLEHEAAVIELLRGTDLAELVPHQSPEGGDTEGTATADVDPVGQALPAEGLEAAGDGLGGFELAEADYAVHLVV